MMGDGHGAGPYPATVFDDSSRPLVKKRQLFQNLFSAIFGRAGLDVLVFPCRAGQASILLFGEDPGPIACRN